MGILDKLFGRKKEVPEAKQAEKSSQPGVYWEKDNRGSFQDTVDRASAYWIARMQSVKKDPFVLYVFDSEKDAIDALLEIPCIHIANDSGRMICSEVLNYGYYPNEKTKTDNTKYEAVLCGADLTHATWEIAKNSFIKHGGKPLAQGELEPPKSSATVYQSEKIPEPDKVVFIREDRQVKVGKTLIYRIYKAPDVVSAKAFLANNPVNQALLYYIVETPEGNYCRDIQGMYKE
jgi:hypothetical protein